MGQMRPRRIRRRQTLRTRLAAATDSGIVKWRRGALAAGSGFRGRRRPRATDLRWGGCGPGRSEGGRHCGHGRRRSQAAGFAGGGLRHCGLHHGFGTRLLGPGEAGGRGEVHEAVADCLLEAAGHGPPEESSQRASLPARLCASSPGRRPRPRGQQLPEPRPRPLLLTL
ncbi:hypothetical protein PVAP13_7NG285124 [Panicum virgatum]|uniref:Uncharacterized protein n=1 Tax=Panicum virgatum TaxID=38727 RepID=A0A8T0Q4G2_PANVG|nr:hypothetical protein PVAP13_7NG285124 [Panicum virgatum]